MHEQIENMILSVKDQQIVTCKKYNFGMMEQIDISLADKTADNDSVTGNVCKKLQLKNIGEPV